MGNRYYLSHTTVVELTDLGLVVTRGRRRKRVTNADAFAELAAACAGGMRAVRQVVILSALVVEAHDRGLSDDVDALLQAALSALVQGVPSYQHTAFGHLCSIVDGDAKYLNAAAATLSDERACKSSAAWQA